MLLEVKNLFKTYVSGKLGVKALRDVNINLGKAEFAAIAGPSGSGKTTLLNCIGTIGKYAFHHFNTAARGQQFIHTIESSIIYYYLKPVRSRESKSS